MQEKVFVEHFESYIRPELDLYFEHIINNSILEKIKSFTEPKVLLKVNNAGPFSPEKAVNVHPAIVQSISAILKKYGCKVSVGDGLLLSNGFQKSGIEKAAHIEQVDLVNFTDYDHPVSRLEVPTKDRVNYYDVEYSKHVLEADIVINIGKLKTHLLTYYTGAIKNFYGCVKKEQRRELHKVEAVEDFAALLVSIYHIRLPDLNIIDGITAMEGSGPTHGDPVHTGYLLASTKGHILDWVCSGLIGYKPEQIPTISYALQQGLLNESEAHNVQFDSIKPDVIEGFKALPILSPALKKRFKGVLEPKVEIIPEKCTSCKLCIKVCPVHAVVLEEKAAIIKEKCIKCYCCAEFCPTSAIKIDSFNMLKQKIEMK